MTLDSCPETPSVSGLELGSVRPDMSMLPEYALQQKSPDWDIANGQACSADSSPQHAAETRLQLGAAVGQCDISSAFIVAPWLVHAFAMIAGVHDLNNILISCMLCGRGGQCGRLGALRWRRCGSHSWMLWWRWRGPWKPKMVRLTTCSGWWYTRLHEPGRLALRLQVLSGA